MCGIHKLHCVMILYIGLVSSLFASLTSSTSVLSLLSTYSIDFITLCDLYDEFKFNFESNLTNENKNRCVKCDDKIGLMLHHPPSILKNLPPLLFTVTSNCMSEWFKRRFLYCYYYFL